MTLTRTSKGASATFWWTLGLPLSVYDTSADVQDRVGAHCLLAGLKPFVPRLKKIWADGAYAGEKLSGWLEEQGGWELQIVERDREAKGFEVLPRRWIVERTFSWLIRNRRLSKDYERLVQTRCVLRGSQAHRSLIQPCGRPRRRLIRNA